MFPNGFHSHHSLNNPGTNNNTVKFSVNRSSNIILPLNIAV